MGKEKKTALLLIPSAADNICRREYLSKCIEMVTEENFIPLTPALYESAELDHDEFIDKMLPYVDAVYLFVNFGIDQGMFRVIDIIIGKKEIHYRRIVESEVRDMYYTPESVLRDVCTKAGISADALRSRSRKREIVDMRFVYYRRCKEKTRASLMQIGRLLLRDHATVLHGINEARNTKAVIELYNRLYGTQTREPDPLPVSKPVLPYRSADRREQDTPSGDPFVQSLAGNDYNRPYHGYTPHNQ